LGSSRYVSGFCVFPPTKPRRPLPLLIDNKTHIRNPGTFTTHVPCTVRCQGAGQSGICNDWDGSRQSPTWASPLFSLLDWRKPNAKISRIQFASHVHNSISPASCPPQFLLADDPFTESRCLGRLYAFPATTPRSPPLPAISRTEPKASPTESLPRAYQGPTKSLPRAYQEPTKSLARP
jgi:hypothetical protein